MNIYYNLLKALLNKDIYTRYNTNINLVFIKENYPELNKVYKSLYTLQAKESKDYTIDDLEVSFYGDYPNSKQDVYQPIFKNLRECNADPSATEGYFAKSKVREIAVQSARTALEFVDGKQDESTFLETFKETLVQLEKSLSSKADTDSLEDHFISSDIELIHKELQLEPGLKWRLPSLNKNLGPLRKGDFGFIAARPETGKTTFLASEVTHMATQTNDNILWFNNEERGKKVITRCYQANQAASLSQIYSDPKGSRKLYLSMCGDRIQINKDEEIVSKTFVEKQCEIHKPALIIFDQIDKISGFEAERYDLKMKSIYAWARDLARKYCPVIGVCQAGGTADGKKWLTMNDIDSSHTAKQGEADWILGIGCTFEDGLEEVRYFHLMKNKQDGGPDQDETQRHGKWEVKIKPEIARYEDY